MNVHEMSHEIIQEGDEHHQVDEIRSGQVDLNQIQPLHCEHVSGHVKVDTLESEIQWIVKRNQINHVMQQVQNMEIVVLVYQHWMMVKTQQYQQQQMDITEV